MPTVDVASDSSILSTSAAKQHGVAVKRPLSRIVSETTCAHDIMLTLHLAATGIRLQRVSFPSSMVVDRGVGLTLHILKNSTFSCRKASARQGSLHTLVRLCRRL